MDTQKALKAQLGEIVKRKSHHSLFLKTNFILKHLDRLLFITKSYQKSNVNTFLITFYTLSVDFF